MKRQPKRQRAFVTNELPIVFAIAWVLCGLLLSAAARSLPWYGKILGSFGLTFVGFLCLTLVGSCIEACAAQRKARNRTQPR